MNGTNSTKNEYIIYMGMTIIIVQILQRLLLTAQVRAAEQNPSVNLVEIADYTVYRQTVLFFALIDLIIRDMWSGIQTKPDQASFS